MGLAKGTRKGLLERQMKIHKSPALSFPPPKKEGGRWGEKLPVASYLYGMSRKKSIVFRNEEIFDDVKPRYEDSEAWPLYKPNNGMLRSKEVG